MREFTQGTFKSFLRSQCLMMNTQRAYACKFSFGVYVGSLVSGKDRFDLTHQPALGLFNIVHLENYSLASTEDDWGSG